jgi:hypothetical protein
MPDGWRMIFGMQTGRIVGTDPELGMNGWVDVGPGATP